MADSPPPSISSTLYKTDIPSAGNYSGHPVDASNVDAQNGPAFSIPTLCSAPRTTKHTLMGIRAAEGHSQRANDPFDYEQKYPEDEEYQEMGPMARIWKVFLDECGKFDTEMVKNWRDALDVLLVFAGLFSAVVTTFVSQTCQNLQPNFQEINASKMNEVSELIRAAILNGTEGVLSIPRSADTAASFRPSLSALWVNGLWFTSLALSLTTALIAVLTKQWIHQYMSVPSGTPRDRSRIRQFRYMSLQQWQVPVIIGLLPVLMHISLGVFFAGLTVFLCSLNTTIAGVIGSIAAAAFGVYIITNLLPLFKPGCPYKTPLTIHSHSLSRHFWHRCQQVIHRLSPPTETVTTQTDDSDSSIEEVNTIPTELLSLKALEREQVNIDASNIDIQCLSWLFSASSNSSVQRVAMQAVSNLPLQDSNAVSESIPSLKSAIASTMISIQERPAERPVYERLFRALSRIEDDFSLPRCLFGSEQGDQRLSILTNYDHRSLEAAEFLRAQLVGPTVKMDVLPWALIMKSALHSGTGWLDVNVTDSTVWQSVFPMFIGSHCCTRDTNCDLSRKELVTLTVLSPPGLDKCPLTILDGMDTTEALSLKFAITEFMFPSFTKLVLNAYQPSLRIFPPELPADISLQLNLMISPSVRSLDFRTEELWQCIELYIGLAPSLNCRTTQRHPEIIMPMFCALLDVICADDFVESDTLTLAQKMDSCLFLLRTFFLDSELQPNMGALITPSIMKRIIDVAFVPCSPRLPSPLITDILNLLVASKSPLSVKVYTLLHERQWLEEIEALLSCWPKPEVPLQRRECSYKLSYPFLACAYAKGLQVLKDVNPDEYQRTMQYLEPRNLFRISKLILLADTSGRQSLDTLACLVGNAAWTKCSEELNTFLSSKEGRALYDYHAGARHGRHPFNVGLQLSYGPFDDLKDLLYCWAWIDARVTDSI